MVKLRGHDQRGACGCAGCGRGAVCLCIPYPCWGHDKFSSDCPACHRSSRSTVRSAQTGTGWCSATRRCLTTPSFQTPSGNVSAIKSMMACSTDSGYASLFPGWCQWQELRCSIRTAARVMSPSIKWHNCKLILSLVPGCCEGRPADG
eukprot:366245-Chlamydomonas_euryale.AAC.38